jgi:undecaprenyl-diphosphatase
MSDDMAEVCTGAVDTGFIALGYGKVAALGVVQGLTELLPISSTAHMRIIPAWLGWQDPGSAFSAAMQLAALAAVVSYFWHDVRDLAVGSTRALRRADFSDWHLRFVIWIGLATLPIAMGGLLMSKYLNACHSPLRSLDVIGYACLLMAALLFLAEYLAKHQREMAHISLLDTMIVGVAQVGALIPGVSRSGSTLTAALMLGMKREEAARFAFLLGLPAIFLAGAKEIWELYHVHLPLEGWLILATGLIVASLSAFVAIWSLMHILEKFSAWPFIIYRAVLGVFLLIGSQNQWF